MGWISVGDEGTRLERERAMTVKHVLTLYQANFLSQLQNGLVNRLNATFRYITN